MAFSEKYTTAEKKAADKTGVEDKKSEVTNDAYLQAEMLEELTKIMWASRSK